MRIVKNCHKNTSVLLRNFRFRDRNLETIEVVDGETTVLVVLKCYGFRHIQNQVQKLKRSKCNYGYVEIMACPSGCISGGGQIRGATADERKRILSEIELPYSGSTDEAEREMEGIKEEWAKLNPNWTDMLFTQYHIVDKTILDRINTDW
ncbi:unnamed protein product [Gongylonema pulchrum]|uniref:Fe_hyd_lg_C domain-containing protein n=1 Tax=Gongylonema pulchrum TaxID=637853 RepID=A0A183D7A4_9BILA|nr:unnamed protein product [Gongylonema pulchrum]